MDQDDTVQTEEGTEEETKPAVDGAEEAEATEGDDDGADEAAEM